MVLAYTITPSDLCDDGHPDFNPNARPYTADELDYLHRLDDAVDRAFELAGLDRRTTPSKLWTKEIRAAVDLFERECTYDVNDDRRGRA